MNQKSKIARSKKDRQGSGPYQGGKYNPPVESATNRVTRAAAAKSESPDNVKDGKVGSKTRNSVSFIKGYVQHFFKVFN